MARPAVAAAAQLCEGRQTGRFQVEWSVTHSGQNVTLNLMPSQVQGSDSCSIEGGRRLCGWILATQNINASCLASNAPVKA